MLTKAWTRFRDRGYHLAALNYDSDAVIKTYRLVMAALSVLPVASAALPEPPAQHQPWTPPDARGIPKYVVTVAERLFDAGLPDPRGGEYREIEFAIPRREFPKPVDRLKTHAWVFGTQYAVGWNGLVYRPLTVGAKADLDGDVRAVAAAEPWSGRWPFRREPAPERAAFWFDISTPGPLPPIAIALLLRLGRADLALLLWQAPEPNEFPGPAWHHEADAPQLLATAVRSWLGAAYWRLISARDRDDEQEAIDIGESLMVWGPRTLATDTSFLEPVPALIADSRRRLAEPARPKLDLRALADTGKSADPDTAAFLRKPQSERIAELIGRLEDVRGEKVSFPGELFYSFDPVCALLAKEGNAAVEPLLNASEHDQRLTRTMDYGRPWYVEQRPVPVSKVAKVILTYILKTPDFMRGAADWQF